MNHSKKLFAITIFLLATSQYTYSSEIKKTKDDYIKKQWQFVDQVGENIFSAVSELDNPEKIDESIKNRMKDLDISKTYLYQVYDKQNQTRTIAIENFNYDRDWKNVYKALNELNEEKKYTNMLQNIFKSLQKDTNEPITVEIAKENKKFVGCIAYIRKKDKEKIFFEEILILNNDSIIEKVLQNHMNSGKK